MCEQNVVGWLFSRISASLGGDYSSRQILCIFHCLQISRLPPGPSPHLSRRPQPEFWRRYPVCLRLRDVAISRLFFLKCMGFWYALRSLPPCAFSRAVRFFSCRSSRVAFPCRRRPETSLMCQEHKTWINQLGDGNTKK